MELFAKLYSSLLVFVYHCFDRIVIHGYLSGLSRPEQVAYFFHEVLGMPVVDKEVLRQRTNDYQELGGGLRPQPQHPHPMGRKGSPQRGSGSTGTAPDGEGQRLRRLLHFQEHGTGSHLPCHRAEVSHPGSQLPHSGTAVESVHTLLLLYPG